VRIGIVATHSFPIPWATHTGDAQVILDLTAALLALGHQITVYAPEGSQLPAGARLLPMPASYGKAPPWSWDCEEKCFADHAADLRAEDVVHDFSNTKRIAEILMAEGRPVVSTLLGGVWAHPYQALNICVWSQAMRQRGLRGATDYEGTPTPDMGGPPQRPIKDARVVHGGVDTDFYSPGDGGKKGFFLWMNRWHPAKGYKTAIDLARKMTGLQVVMAGEHPDREMFEYQRACAHEAVRMASGLPNVTFEWLPADPDHHTAKRELYRQARALLYTVQFQEPFGLSQVEALACGTPVIGTRFGSVPEVVEHGRTGWVCDNTTEAFAEGCDMVRGFEYGNKVPTFRPVGSSADCRESALSRFDRSVMARAYVDCYLDAIAGKGWGA